MRVLCGVHRQFYVASTLLKRETCECFMGCPHYLREKLVRILRGRPLDFQSATSTEADCWASAGIGRGGGWDLFTLCYLEMVHKIVHKVPESKQRTRTPFPRFQEE